MAKTTDRVKGESRAATTLLMENGGLPAEPQTEAPAASPQRRRVLGLQVEELPSKYDLKAEKPFPFRSVEQYSELEAKPVRHILKRILSSGWVKFTAIAGAALAPFVQIGISEKTGIGLYSYFSQQADNFSKVFSGVYEHSSAILLGFAAAVAVVGLSVPFVSSKGREEAIREKEQEHESEEMRKAHKSARRWEEAHRMVRKFRGASLLAALPLAASDFLAYANGGFRGAAQFFQEMGASAQVAAAAFLALIAASVFTYVKSNKARMGAADKSYAYNAIKQEEEEKANAPAVAREAAESEEALSALEEAAAAEDGRAYAAAESAGIPTNVVDISRRAAEPEKKASCGIQPASEEEANGLQQLYSIIEQQRYEIEQRRADARVIAEKLGLALAANEAIERRLLSQERAAESIRENDGLKKSLAARRSEISLLSANIEESNEMLKRLEAERDGLAREHGEKDGLLRDATLRLEELDREAQRLRAELIAAKSAKPKPVETAAAKRAPPQKEEVPIVAAPVAPAPGPATAGPVAPVESPEPAAPAQSPASEGPAAEPAAPETLRGSPVEGGLPATVVDSSNEGEEDPDGYRPGGPAVSI